MDRITRGVRVLVALAAAMFAGLASAATLKEIVEKTVTTNPEVQANFHSYKAAMQEQTAAKGVFYPHADIISTFRDQERLVPNTSNAEAPDRQTQLVLRQMLFDGFATRSEVNRLGHAARVRYYELQNSMQNVALDLVKTYIDVQRYRQLTEYAQSNYVVHKQLFDRIEERVNAGVARRVDLEQASGRLALAEANLLTETTNLQNVTARFQRLSGELPPDTLEEVDFLKEGLPSDVNQALQLAYKQNPALLSTIENIVASQQEVEGKRARYYPRLDLQARKNLDTSSNGRNSSLAADTLELTATFNLFNGFTDKALIDQAGEKLNVSYDMRDKACIDTRQTLAIAYNDVVSLSEQLGYRDQHQLSIEKAREAYRKQFDIGQRTLLDLLDTENEYFQARRSYTNTQRDLYTAYARTYAGEGDLLSKLGVVRGDLPDIGQADYSENYATCQAAAPEMIKIDKVSLVANAKPLSVASDKQIPKPMPAKSAQVCSVEEVTGRVNDWASAWRHKDFDNYMRFYADKFAPEPPLSRADWEKQRKERIVGAGKINLELSDMKVTCEGDKAKAVFDQDYSVTKYKLQKSKDDLGCEVCNAKRIPIKGFADKVNKQLEFEKIGSQWQIVRELINK